MTEHQILTRQSELLDRIISECKVADEQCRKAIEENNQTIAKLREPVK